MVTQDEYDKRCNEKNTQTHKQKAKEQREEKKNPASFSDLFSCYPRIIIKERQGRKGSGICTGGRKREDRETVGEFNSHRRDGLLFLYLFLCLCRIHLQTPLALSTTS